MLKFSGPSCRLSGLVAFTPFNPAGFKAASPSICAKDPYVIVCGTLQHQPTSEWAGRNPIGIAGRGHPVRAPEAAPLIYSNEGSRIVLGRRETSSLFDLRTLATISETLPILMKAARIPRRIKETFSSEAVDSNEAGAWLLGGKDLCVQPSP